MIRRRGGPGPDTLAGGPGDDVLRGRGGDDVLTGGAGDDRLFGGAGRDRLFGGPGHDRLTGGPGAGDLLAGGPGDDVLSAAGARALLMPGPGADLARGPGDAGLSYADLPSAVRVDLRAGTARGADTDDRVFGVALVIGTDFADVLRGSNAGDWQGFVGGPGADVIHGRGGFDEVLYALEGGPQGVRVDLAAGRARDSFGDLDRLRGIEGAMGTRFDDVLIGGGAGFEAFRGLAGADRIIGGPGLTRADYSADAEHGGTAGVRADLARGFAVDGFGDRDRLRNVEQVRGTEAADLLRGDGKANRLEGLGGPDRLAGRGGDDRLFGGAGRDRLEGGAGRDELWGEGGADRLFGGRGDDRLDGGPGHDRLTGGPGDDVLTGGAGRDLFVFAPGDGRDVIADFEPGRDRVRLDGRSDLAGFHELNVAEGPRGLRLKLGQGDAVLFRGLAEGDLGPDQVWLVG